MKENIERNIKDLRNYISFSSKSCNFSDDEDWKFCKETADKIQHILSAYEKLQKENEELSIVKNLVESFELNQIQADKYILMAKEGFLNSSYKKLLDDFIAKKKIESKVSELNKEISKMELKYKNSFLKGKEKIREELVRLDERLKTYIELLKEE